jgi:hypothetical protein
MYVEGERNQISAVQVLPYNTVCSLLLENYTRRPYAKGGYPQSVATAVKTTVKIDCPVNPNITDRVRWKKLTRVYSTVGSEYPHLRMHLKVREAVSTMTC